MIILFDYGMYSFETKNTYLKTIKIVSSLMRFHLMVNIWLPVDARHNNNKLGTNDKTIRLWEVKNGSQK